MEDPVLGDMEMDAYDRAATIYLLAKDRPDGQVLTSVRLIAITGTHLLFSPADQERMPRGSHSVGGIPVLYGARRTRPG